MGAQMRMWPSDDPDAPVEYTPPATVFSLAPAISVRELTPEELAATLTEPKHPEWEINYSAPTRIVMGLVSEFVPVNDERHRDPAPEHWYLSGANPRQLKAAWDAAPKTVEEARSRTLFDNQHEKDIQTALDFLKRAVELKADVFFSH